MNKPMQAQVDVPAAYDKIEKDFQQAMTDSRLAMLAGLKLDIAHLAAAKLAHELTLTAKG